MRQRKQVGLCELNPLLCDGDPFHGGWNIFLIDRRIERSRYRYGERARAREGGGKRSGFWRDPRGNEPLDDESNKTK